MTPGMASAFSSPTSRNEDGLYLPENASWFTRLRVSVRALKILEKQPDDGIAAPLLGASMDGGVFAQHVARLLGTDAGRALLRERPSLQGSVLDLHRLRALPEGTLGHALTQYYRDNGIQPFESPYEIRNDVDFICRWYRETHDLHHVVTGYGTDPVGEMELQAFMVGHLGLWTGRLILAFAAILRPRGLPPIWRYAQKLRAARDRGRRCGDLLALRYDQRWDVPVHSLRAELGLAAADGA